MKRTALERQLQRIAIAAANAEDKVIAAARLKYVVPFCNRTGWALCTGMGSWGFHKPGGRQLNDDKLPKRLRAVLEAEIATNSGQSAGSVMEDYTPCP